MYNGLFAQRTTLNDTLIFGAQTWKICKRYSKIRATSPKSIWCEFTSPYHDRYSQKCRFCSQRPQNGHFFTTHVGNQTVPLILVFFWETFKNYSFWMYSTRIACVRSNLAKLSEMFFKSELILAARPNREGCGWFRPQYAGLKPRGTTGAIPLSNYFDAGDPK